ncbi:serine/arginine repetitive matrix protein 1-like [Agelaius tricolor]|uniref:serine/arginine repetitive matrix protein 1-like n=1 Tax=Agelaius tricolor TaxID=9191 RepID=UPI0039F22856
MHGGKKKNKERRSDGGGAQEGSRTRPPLPAGLAPLRGSRASRRAPRPLPPASQRSRRNDPWPPAAAPGTAHLLTQSPVRARRDPACAAAGLYSRVTAKAPTSLGFGLSRAPLVFLFCQISTHTHGPRRRLPAPAARPAEEQPPPPPRFPAGAGEQWTCPSREVFTDGDGTSRDLDTPAGVSDTRPAAPRAAARPAQSSALHSLTSPRTWWRGGGRRRGPRLLAANHPGARTATQGREKKKKKKKKVRGGSTGSAAGRREGAAAAGGGVPAARLGSADSSHHGRLGKTPICATKEEEGGEWRGCKLFPPPRPLRCRPAPRSARRPLRPRRPLPRRPPRRLPAAPGAAGFLTHGARRRRGSWFAEPPEEGKEGGRRGRRSVSPCPSPGGASLPALAAAAAAEHPSPPLPAPTAPLGPRAGCGERSAPGRDCGRRLRSPAPPPGLRLPSPRPRRCQAGGAGPRCPPACPCVPGYGQGAGASPPHSRGCCGANPPRFRTLTEKTVLTAMLVLK